MVLVKLLNQWVQSESMELAFKQPRLDRLVPNAPPSEWLLYNKK